METGSGVASESSSSNEARADALLRSVVAETVPNASPPPHAGRVWNAFDPAQSSQGGTAERPATSNSQTQQPSSGQSQSPTCTQATVILTQTQSQEAQPPSRQPNVDDDVPAALPQYAPADNRLTIGDFDVEASCQILNAAYEEIVHFKPNQFSIPQGAMGSQFVNIIAQLLQCFGDESRGEGMALKAAMVATQLLLQQPHRTFDRQAHLDCLTRRLLLWQDGDIDELMRESRYIQQQLKEATPTSDRREGRKDDARIFSSFVTNGKISAATAMLAPGGTGGVHSLDTVLQERSVGDILREKHPPAAPLHHDGVIQGEPPLVPHPVLFTNINRDAIKSAALNTMGAAGPSGMDAAEWRRMCTSFKAASDGLCDALARCAKRIAANYIDPASLEAYVACRLIPLDKQPGVRPIGIGEVMRRIIGKAILAVASRAVEKAAGSTQLCAGQESGVEAAIHAMRTAYEQEEVQGVLLADASNAFNCLNRSVCIANIRHLCPELHPVIANTYRMPARLFVGGEEIASCEGTTQGDPLAMPMYALGTIPLVRKASAAGAMQSWFADDSTAAGKVRQLRAWWKVLEDEGDTYGYNINASKSVLLVKPEFEAEAKEAFADTAVEIRTDGCRHLGAAIGSEHFCQQYVTAKVQEWCHQVERLAEFASTEPQAAYAAFVHGLRHKWSFLARTMPGTADLFQPLEDVISHSLIPSITGRQPPGDLERALLALPCRDGGLGLLNPTTLGSQYDSSVKITRPLVERIHSCNHSSDGVADDMKAAKAEVREAKRETAKTHVQSVTAQLEPESRRVIELAAEKGASSWLTSKPLKRHGFRLNKGTFRDGLCLRYGWTPPRLPSLCPCGKSFTVTHAMDCKLGGYPSLRHDEVRNVTATMLREVAHDVALEPSLQPLSGETFNLKSVTTDAQARVDVAASGLWGGRFERTFIDVRVFNPWAPSNQKPTLAAAYDFQERVKRRKYQHRILTVEHGSFVPAVFSTTGGQSKASSALYGRIASMMADKRREPYSVTLAQVRATLSFALVKSTVAGLRGHRRSTGKTHFAPS